MLFAASSGGHLEEILCLSDMAEQTEATLLTERTAYETRAWFRRMYLVPQVNRKEILLPFKLLWISILSLRALLKEKPDAVVTTGVLAVIPVCLLAKLLGKKFIFIESFADIHSPTRTGKLLYKYADVFIVQWESMLEFYPNAIYGGTIY